MFVLNLSQNDLIKEYFRCFIEIHELLLPKAKAKVKAKSSLAEEIQPFVANFSKF